jgi:lactate permease
MRQAMKATSVWLKRFIGPFLSYSLYLCIADVVANSAKTIANGILGPSQSYNALNMNVVLGSTLAAIFGAGYIFVAASLGLFGAVVGGSETSSNILFLKIQRTAAQDVHLTNAQFVTVYGSHAVAGGRASAITPAKTNNAVVTIDESHDT